MATQELETSAGASAETIARAEQKATELAEAFVQKEAELSALKSQIALLEEVPKMDDSPCCESPDPQKDLSDTSWSVCTAVLTIQRKVVAGLSRVATSAAAEFSSLPVFYHQTSKHHAWRVAMPIHFLSKQSLVQDGRAWELKLQYRGVVAKQAGASP